MVIAHGGGYRIASDFGVVQPDFANARVVLNFVVENSPSGDISFKLDGRSELTEPAKVRRTVNAAIGLFEDSVKAEWENRGRKAVFEGQSQSVFEGVPVARLSTA